MAVAMNIFLGILGCACVFPIMMQDILFPELPAYLNVLLRILAAVFIQLLFCRLGKKKTIVRWIPVMITGMAATWGFFLYLTAPSWINAGFAAFFRDYAMPLLVCLCTILVRFAIKRLRRRLRREKMRKRAIQQTMGTPPKKKKKI